MKTGRKLTGDDDLKTRRDRDDYHIGRIAKFTCLFAFVAIVVFILVFFMLRVWDDKVFRYSVLDIVQQNISGIVFTGLSLIGLNKFYKK